ncbi:MAG: CBS domain-containing protein [Desulfonatronovibrio sp. MSAO_Bac4]|nr:MAG: CBS domain-containing protein [Desulfonatronovibrio sp. MSAO_Bac4]
MQEKYPEHPQVKDLMVGLDEFSVISDDSFFIDAHKALEKANEDFMSGRQKFRILLVQDVKGRIVGKLSPMDLVQGLEPKYADVIDPNRLKFKDALYVIKSMTTQKVLWDKPLDSLCQVAQNTRIREFLKFPAEGHKVKMNDSLDNALHLFVVARHDSLFVVEGSQLVGLLLFSDVYKYISDMIKDSCRLD